MNSLIGNLLIGALVLVSFQNCGNKVGFNDAKSINDIPVNGAGDDDDISGDIDIDLDGPEDDDIDVINKKCNNSTPQVATVALSFPKPNETCAFGVGDNLPINDMHLTARIEQKRSLNLPVGAVICDAQFTFVEQPWKYDDHFLVLFNKSVIAASYDFSVTNTLQKKNFGLLEYDWMKIAGMVWNPANEAIFCPNIAGGTSNCSFPDTDVGGAIELEYDSKFIRSIMTNGIPSNHSFSVVSVGDNDPQDCEHSDLEFTVQVKYVK